MKHGWLQPNEGGQLFKMQNSDTLYVIFNNLYLVNMIRIEKLKYGFDHF